MASVVMPGAALPRTAHQGDERFFFTTAIVMAFVVCAGFSVNLATGRSTFAMPARIHLHALLFFGWTAIYVIQSALANRGSLALHRRLGWLAAVWMPSMVASGIFITASNVAQGRVPPFFEPAYFLVMNPVHIVTVAALVLAAILMRRQTRWHRRLMFCSMALLTAPAVGRLLPMPLLVPYAGIAVVVPSMVLMAVGAVRDWRRERRVHPAWWWGMGTAVGMVLLIQAVAYSAPGLAIYEAVTAGSASALPALEFQPVPGA